MKSKLKNLFILTVASAGFSACASPPEIVEEGVDTYVAYKQGATGFTGTNSLKIEAMKAARDYCVEMKKQVHVVSTNETPAGILGRYPSAEVHFKCL